MSALKQIQSCEFFQNMGLCVTFCLPGLNLCLVQKDLKKKYQDND